MFVLMTVGLLAAGVVVVGLAAGILLGRVRVDPGAPAGEVGPTVPALSAEPSAEEVAALRLDVAVRGYRMDQVDAVLEVLGHRIGVQQARIEQLERARGEGAGEASGTL